jgi:hypothetical protein
MHLRTHTTKRGISAGTRSPSADGLVVLQLVSEALPLKEALPLRRVCTTLCDIIGDRVKEL